MMTVRVVVAVLPGRRRLDDDVQGQKAEHEQ
jgi:hypothetical protein